MNGYRHGSHSVFEIHLHLVWVTKFREPVLVGALGTRLRKLVREIHGAEDVQILKGHVSKDHMHLLVSNPPQVTISRPVQRLKGRTAYKLLHEFAPLKRQFWGRHLWARGYFCHSSGNVTEEVVTEYIANQGQASPDDFRMEQGTSSPPHVGDLGAHLGWVASSPPRVGELQPSLAR